MTLEQEKADWVYYSKRFTVSKWFFMLAIPWGSFLFYKFRQDPSRFTYYTKEMMVIDSCFYVAASYYLSKHYQQYKVINAKYLGDFTTEQL